MVWGPCSRKCVRLFHFHDIPGAPHVDCRLQAWVSQFRTYLRGHANPVSLSQVHGPTSAGTDSLQLRPNLDGEKS